MSAYAVYCRSSYVFRQRFGLSAAQEDLLNELVPEPEAPAAPPAPAFVAAWRNYVRSVFRPGWMYRIRSCPRQLLYVMENKTLAGKEGRGQEGEAQGRKLAVVFFEPLHGDLVRRVHRDTSGMHVVLMTVAELLQTLAPQAVPQDPDRTAAEAEMLLEAEYQRLEILQYKCSIEPEGGEEHVYQLTDEVHAEVALFLAVPAEKRTKMELARLLQRREDLAPGESLQAAWSLNLLTLQHRAAPHLPAPPPPAPEARRCATCNALECF